MSAGQKKIVQAILLKTKPRVACLAPTGYGKSEAVSMGVILRSIFMREEFIIASVKFGTSDIIMSKVIEHIFDNQFFVRQLELEQGSSLDRLKRERKKENITFKHGGSIKIISLHGKDDDVGKAIGEHAKNIILDESPLLSPTKYFQVLKILEGTGKYEETFLFELGNAVNRNHFMTNVRSNPRYYSIEISLDQAISEGRLDQQSVDEKRDMPLFEQFYLNKFPNPDEVDEGGYRALLTEEQVSGAMVNACPYWPTIEKKLEGLLLGADIAGGGDDNAYIARSRLIAWIDGFNRSSDTMVNVTEIENRIEKGLIDGNVFIDDIGVGRGSSDRLKEKGYAINAVSVGVGATDSQRYANLRAEIYWSLRQWILNGGKLIKDQKFLQLTWIKYKATSDKVIQIEPKDELKKRTGKSPDYADALALTFAPPEVQPNIR